MAWQKLNSTPKCQNRYMTVTEDEFNRVQHLIASEHRTRRQKHEFAFTGMIRCGVCGGLFGPKVWHSKSKYRKIVWQCNEKYADRHHKCSSPHLYEDALQDMFVKAVNSIITRKDEIIGNFGKLTEEIFNTSQNEAQLEAVRVERREIVSRMEKLNTENANVAMDQHTYQDRFKQLSSEYTEVNKHLTNLEGAIHERKS